MLGVIANVERLKKADDKAKGDASEKIEFYMKQTGDLDNACGVIASLHAVLNNLSSISLKPDSILQQFKMESAEKSPEERATLLEGFKAF